MKRTPQSISNGKIPESFKFTEKNAAGIKMTVYGGNQTTLKKDEPKKSTSPEKRSSPRLKEQKTIKETKETQDYRQKSPERKPSPIKKVEAYMGFTTPNKAMKIADTKTVIAQLNKVFGKNKE